MRSKFLICAAIAALTLGGFAVKTVAAGKGRDAAAPVRGPMLKRIANKLDLTADQRSQIKAVLAGERKTLAPLLEQVHTARVNLRAAIRATDANETTVRAAAAKAGAAEADLAVERMKLYGKIAPILTGAQRRQLAGLQQRADDSVDKAIARYDSGLGD